MRNALLAAALFALVVGCQYNADVKASTSTGVLQANADGDVNTSPPPQQAEPAPPPQPVASEAPPPPSQTCPIACYAPSGANHNLVTSEEHAQIKAALEPAFARMHACMDGSRAEAPQYDGQGYRVRRGRWHRSPVLNLRIAPDGKLEDLGVDPHHGYDERCMDSAAREASTNLALPGRHTIRCHEQCVAPADPRVGTPATPRARPSGKGTRRR